MLLKLKIMNVQLVTKLMYYLIPNRKLKKLAKTFRNYSERDY